MDDESRRSWAAVQDLLGSKWTVQVVRALAETDRGFAALQRELDGVTAKTLSARLSELTCLGFVDRQVTATSPPRTNYRLTEAGERLATVLADVRSLVDVEECPDGACPVAADPSDRDCSMAGGWNGGAAAAEGADDCACDCCAT